ncbi:MAG: hypothetical protein QOD42_1855 [Sphingomonadales bacterium]|nr:hypothetical protein [Sphingomonadales bacterium]
MPIFTPLDGEQIRQLVNSEQAYAALRAAETERDLHFRGSMAWKTVGERDYLYRKLADAWKSVGRRGPETELAFERFHAGRAGIKARITALDDTIRRMAAVNRAMRLGRVPWVAARLLRKLERKQLPGRAISVVGTHALYAYERMAGGHFHPSHVATLDIDLLYDARDRLRLLAPDTREEGLQGILRSVDASFAPLTPGGFRAVNKSGFMVDLIRPMPANPAFGDGTSRVGDDATDLTAAQIEGLGWLQNCPQVQQTVVDERGYPLRLDVPDPRAFALHKLWVSERPDRDRMKARRDAGQAKAVAGLVLDYLPHLGFDDEALRAMPAALRARAPDLLAMARLQGSTDDEDW